MASLLTPQGPKAPLPISSCLHLSTATASCDTALHGTKPTQGWITDYTGEEPASIPVRCFSFRNVENNVGPVQSPVRCSDVCVGGGGAPGVKV
jgi:hypothetical protein